MEYWKREQKFKNIYRSFPIPSLNTLGSFVFNVRQSYCAAHVIDIGWTSVRPSICLSVRHTLVLCLNGSTYRQTVFTAW